MRDLTQRVVALEGKAKSAYRRLLAWSIAAAVVSSASIWLLVR
jgi:hypothetical protein